MSYFFWYYAVGILYSTTSLYYVLNVVESDKGIEDIRAKVDRIGLPIVILVFSFIWPGLFLSMFTNFTKRNR